MADARWVGQTADRIVAVLEQSRSTWQMWHVRAEAQRQVRTIDLPAEQSTRLVDLLVYEVLDHRSIALTAPPDGIEEPDELRRADGSSVYTVAGADRYTSQRILDAEQRILTAAGRHDGAVGRPIRRGAGAAGNGGERHHALDAGQAALVRQMCTSGARVAAGDRAGRRREDRPRCAPSPWPGPKTAVRSSASPRPLPRPPSWPNTPASRPTPWPNSPGRLQHDDLPDWAAHIDGPSTLMIIDEAGMADTLSLDTAVQYAIDRGASVRLIGDDQQLAAIGAGGILRDIKHTTAPCSSPNCTASPTRPKRQSPRPSRRRPARTRVLP